MHDKFQGKLTFQFGMLICQGGRQIFHTSTFLLWSDSKERVLKYIPQTAAVLKEDIGSEITSIDSKVPKAIIDIMKKGLMTVTSQVVTT